MSLRYNLYFCVSEIGYLKVFYKKQGHYVSLQFSDPLHPAPPPHLSTGFSQMLGVLSM